MPPEVDDQVVVLSPDGVLEQGVVVSGLFYSKTPAPSQDEAELKINLNEDDSFITFNKDTNRLNCKIANDGGLKIECGESSSFLLKNDGFVGKSGQIAFEVADETILATADSRTLKIDPDGIELSIQSAASPTIFMDDRTIILKVGMQELELNAGGLYYNGWPLGAA
jgi:phage baseplate assembly protein gpV